MKREVDTDHGSRFRSPGTRAGAPRIRGDLTREQTVHRSSEQRISGNQSERVADWILSLQRSKCPPVVVLGARARVAIPAHTTPHTVQMAALTISAPIVARAGSFAGRKVATKATNGTGKTAMRATWMPGSQPPSYLDGSLPWCVPRAEATARRDARARVDRRTPRGARLDDRAPRSRPRERARRDETSAAERSPTVSGGVRRLFSPPAPRVPDPAPLARDPRHTA